MCSYLEDISRWWQSTVLTRISLLSFCFSGFYKQRNSGLWLFTTGHDTGVGVATESRSFLAFFDSIFHTRIQQNNDRHFFLLGLDIYTQRHIQAILSMALERLAHRQHYRGRGRRWPTMVCMSPAQLFRDICLRLPRWLVQQKHIVLFWR